MLAVLVTFAAGLLGAAFILAIALSNIEAEERRRVLDQLRWRRRRG